MSLKTVEGPKAGLRLVWGIFDCEVWMTCSGKLALLKILYVTLIHSFLFFFKFSL